MEYFVASEKEHSKKFLSPNYRLSSILFLLNEVIEKVINRSTVKYLKKYNFMNDNQRCLDINQDKDNDFATEIHCGPPFICYFLWHTFFEMQLKER